MTLPNDIAINEAHFEIFKSIRGEGCGWLAGKTPYDWAGQVAVPAAIAESLPRQKLGRRELLEFCKSSSLEASVIATLAWGGMKFSHGRRLIPVLDQLMPIVKDLATGDLSRRSAYAQFAHFRACNRGCGLGPAYYTKLIYFFGKDHNGYIMDQWTSLSVNLLYRKNGAPVIDMTTAIYKGRRTDTVSDKNTADDYETFCHCVEDLATSLGAENAATIEEWLFSQGGRKPAPWRACVLANRPR